MNNRKGIKQALFLDIDGTLSRSEYGRDLYEDTYSDYCVCLHRPSVEALKKLLMRHPDMKIVWLTDWAKTDATACSRQHCYLNPMQALMMFPWIEERVVGSVFAGQYAYAKGDDKLQAIESFIDGNLVESYAIVDDYAYSKPFSRDGVYSHIVHINPLKSMLDDDLPSIEEALDLPSCIEQSYRVLERMEVGSRFTINGRYACAFDFSQYGESKAPLFSSWKDDTNCPRSTSTVNVLVYDNSTGENLIGMLVVGIDKDLNDKKSITLYLKPLGESEWQRSVPVVWLADIVVAKAH